MSNAITPLIEQAQSLFSATSILFKESDSKNVLAVCKQKEDVGKKELEALQQIMEHLNKLNLEKTCENEPCSLTQGILITRSLNRICGRAINLAEQVYFIENGVNTKHKPPTQ